MSRSASVLLFGTVVLAAIGLYDVIVGAILLTSSTPWTAHGPGTAWMSLNAPLPDVTLGLFRRMGALSLHTGVATIVWAILGYRRPKIRSVQFVTYAITGLAFGLMDATFFPDTRYLLVKRVVGAFYFTALIAHFVFVRRTQDGQRA